jgi:hypothetical protein
MWFLEVLDIFWEFYLNWKEKEKQIPMLGQDSGPRPHGLHGWQPTALTRPNGQGGADTSAQPTARGGLLAQLLSMWPGRGSEGSPVAYAG